MVALSRGWQAVIEGAKDSLPMPALREARRLTREAERAQTRLTHALAVPSTVPNDDTVALTPQERAILRGIVAEQTNKEIAAELFISERTVKFHAGNLFRKLSVADRTQAARVGRRFVSS